MRRMFVVLLALCWPGLVLAQAAPTPAPSGLTGEIVAIGSESGNEVFSRWAEAFMALHPGTKIEAIGSGSGSAFPALLEGRSDIAPMSRPMTAGMIDAFTKTRGYAPTVIDIGIGGAVVFVHPSNPIVGLTRAQLDGIWSHTYYISPEAILDWGDAGLGGAWANRGITLYGLPEESGAWGLMRSEATSLPGRLKPTVRQLSTAEAVAAAVADDPSAIGFAPAGFSDARVRVLPLAADLGRGYVGEETTTRAAGEGTDFIAPTPENLAAETYPLTRYFRLYIDQNPAEPMPPVLQEFLSFILSPAAQEGMRRSGYLPLPRAVAETQRSRVP